MTFWVWFMSLVYEVLVILYAREVVKGSVVVSMGFTAALCVLGYLSIKFVVGHDEQIIAATVGHTMGVPVGIWVSKAAFGSRTEHPTPDSGSQSSDPS